MSSQFGGITVTATFSPELHGWVNTTTDVNFTHGFDFQVRLLYCHTYRRHMLIKPIQMQPDSGLLIPIAHLSQTLTYNLSVLLLHVCPLTAPLTTAETSRRSHPCLTQLQQAT